MIKAVGADRRNRPILILGLSGENVTRMVAGEPLHLDTADVGLPQILVRIVYGGTEEDLLAQFEASGLITSDTVRHLG